VGRSQMESRSVSLSTAIMFHPRCSGKDTWIVDFVVGGTAGEMEIERDGRTA